MKHNVLKNASVLLLSLMLVSFQSLAQRQITGKITDSETGEGVPGASVIIQGTTSGTITDFDGNYTLNVDDGATLVISYVGYQTSQVAVGARSVIDVGLSTDLVALEEIVVVGYGTQAVKDATGAVAAISEKDFNSGIISSPEQLIQGRTAGVQITQSTGAPGAGVALRIRGTNSVRSNNNPLFVVDGVPLAGDNSSPEVGNFGGGGTSGASNPLNFLNPSDIESISILKDASSAAIYGSRGANGVVFITTKKGRGAGSLEYTSSASISTPAAEYNLLGRDEFLAGVAQYGGDPVANDFGANTDWQDFITRTSFSHKQNVSYSKGYNNGSVRASIGYEDQQGILKQSSLERITGRLNLNHELTDKLTVNISGTASRVNQIDPPVGASAGFRGDILGAAYSANPTWPTDIEDVANPSDIIAGQLHPGNMLANLRSTANTNRYLFNISADYAVTPELKAKVTYGLDKSDSERIGLATGNGVNFDRGTQGNGRGGFGEIDVTNDLFEATLTYTKEFGNSRIEAVGGYSYQDFGRQGFNAEAWGFGSTEFNEMERGLIGGVRSLNAAAAVVSDGFYQQFGQTQDLRNAPQTSGFFVNQLFPTATTIYAGDRFIPAGGPSSIFADRFNTTDELQSFFARVNYTLSNKYLFTVTVRADGSSRFGTDNQYGIFPSGAFAWKIHEEDFLGDGVFSSLKLRLGAGITGNQDGLGFGSFVRRERYSLGDFNETLGDNGDISVPGLAAVALANPDLQWEETSQISVGLDFGISNERLYGSLDFYRKNTSDLILKLDAAQPSPNRFVFDNFDANVINKGFEFSLNYDVVQSEDLTFTAGFNYSYNENEIQDFDGQIPAGTIRGQGLSLAFSQLLAEDQALFTYFLRNFEGFDAAGQPIGDVQTFQDKGALPTSNLGVNLNLSYKNFDLSTFISGQFGHYVYNNTANAFFTAGSINNARNVTPNVLTSGESGAAEAAVSTRFLESADFVRLQTLAIGYNVPVENTFFRNLRVSLSGQNLFLIDSYSGLDPEVSSEPSQVQQLNELPTAGIDYAAYPRPRVYTLSLNATF